MPAESGNSATGLIADDEPALRGHLERLLSELWPELQIADSVGDGEAAVKAALLRKPDVAFLDVRMPGLSGLEVAKRLCDLGPSAPMIVFATAYDEHAVEAFERAAADYLVKPVTEGRLRETVSRLKARIGAQRAPQAETLSAETVDSIARKLAGAGSHLWWLRVGSGDLVRLVHAGDVQFFRADRKYTAAFTQDSEHLVKLPISELETRLDPNRFWRIHRSAIVNVSAVASARRDFRGRYLLSLRTRNELLPVSAAYAHLFRSM